jgi:hypothetical protein
VRAQDPDARASARVGLWRQLLDWADWRAMLYGLVLMPVGLLASIVALAAGTRRLSSAWGDSIWTELPQKT